MSIPRLTLLPPRPPGTCRQELTEKSSGIRRVESGGDAVAESAPSKAAEPELVDLRPPSRSSSEDLTVIDSVSQQEELDQSDGASTAFDPSDHRPWREFNRSARRTWEQMLTRKRPGPNHDSTEALIAYFRGQDKEFSRYLEDFPLHEWLIPPREAQEAYDQMMEREKLRNLATRIDSEESASPQGHGVVAARDLSEQIPSCETPHDRQHRETEPTSLTPTDAERVTASKEGKIVATQPRAGAEPDVKVPPYPARPPSNLSRKPRYAGPYRDKKQVECKTFPWTRQMDFERAKADARWDDSIYDPETLLDMESTRQINLEEINKLKEEESEKLRVARSVKREKMNKLSSGGSVEERDTADHPDQSSPASPSPQEKRRLKAMQDSIERIMKGRHYGTYCAAFSFATDEDAKAAQELKIMTPEDAIMEAWTGRMPLETSAEIMICWNPAKRGATEGLEQCCFSVKDHVVTRRQVDAMPILTYLAAERICDFCPDLVWHELLLRMVAEAGYSNKLIRDRICINGNHIDSATITKRVSAALGHKQASRGSKLDQERDIMWYNDSVNEFRDYCRYFGRKVIMRIALGQKQELGTQKSKSRGNNKGSWVGHKSQSGDEVCGKKDGDGDVVMKDRAPVVPPSAHKVGVNAEDSDELYDVSD